MSTAYPGVEALIRYAHESLSTATIRVSPAKVSKLCRLYARDIQPRGIPFTPWFVSQLQCVGASRELLTDELYKRIDYRDPTGEEAARRIDWAA